MEQSIDADYLALTKKIETNFKAPKFKVGDRDRITRYQNVNCFCESYIKNWAREMFVIDSVLKANPRTYRIKDSNEEKIIGSFYEKEMLLIKL